jgi:hypothetical protein
LSPMCRTCPSLVWSEVEKQWWSSISLPHTFPSRKRMRHTLQSPKNRSTDNSRWPWKLESVKVPPIHYNTFRIDAFL